MINAILDMKLHKSNFALYKNYFISYNFDTKNLINIPFYVLMFVCAFDVVKIPYNWKKTGFTAKKFTFCTNIIVKFIF